MTDFRLVQLVVIVLLMVGPMCVVATIAMVSRSASTVGRRWPSRPPGTCRRCGYDLRATPDRCPECGAEHPFSDGPEGRLRVDAGPPGRR